MESNFRSDSSRSSLLLLDSETIGSVCVVVFVMLSFLAHGLRFHAENWASFSCRLVCNQKWDVSSSVPCLSRDVFLNTLADSSLIFPFPSFSHFRCSAPFFPRYPLRSSCLSLHWLCSQLQPLLLKISADFPRFRFLF